MKKRFFFFLVVVMIFTSGFMIPVAAGNDGASVNNEKGKPLFDLTKVPLYGEDDFIEGVIRYADGQHANAGDYRISIYLQVTKGGKYWQKPTAAFPYEDLSEDGTFIAEYATGGLDEQAEVIYLMVIPKDFFPTADFQRTKDVAFSYIRIERTENLTISVSGDIYKKKWTSASDLFKVGSQSIALNVGFYNVGRPGTALSEKQARDILTAIRPYTDTVRFYSASGEIEKVYSLAQSMGFQVIGSAWLCGDKEADKLEMDALIEHCRAGRCISAVVGSETLLRGDLYPVQLVKDLEYVRAAVSPLGIPVTTAETLEKVIYFPSITARCDYVFFNYYSYWSGISNEDAAESFIKEAEKLKARCVGRPVVCSETGCPTDGFIKGDAVPGETAAADYFAAIREWSLKSGMQIFFFEACDEPWKTTDEGLTGAHWGILDSNLKIKAPYSKIKLFYQSELQTMIKNRYLDPLNTVLLVKDKMVRIISQ